MKRRIFILCLGIFTIFISPIYLYAMGKSYPRTYIPIRVLMVKGALSVNLEIKRDYKIVDFETEEALMEGKGLKRRVLSSSDISSKGIKILPEKGTRIYINKRQFRGSIDIIKDEDAKLFVVNHIDIEEYLYGVLFHEVSHRWPIEVLKAQAIAARTYALYHKLVSKNKYFDISADIYSQVYGGKTSETWRIRRAVNLTRGHVLTYNGEIFPSYYHATCGGYTSDASSIWDIDKAILKGKECNFCKSSPHYEWKKELNIEYIETKLQDAGYKIQISSIDVLKRDRSGRILDIMIKGRDNNIELRGNKFRLLIGPNIIKSTNFKIQTKGRYVTFYGKGWGHGVGMCQWGAYDMARRGWKASEILGYYYPGVEIKLFEVKLFEAEPRTLLK